MTRPDLPRCLSGVPIAANFDSLFMPRHERPLSRQHGNTLVVSIIGVLTHRPSFGFSSSTAVVDVARELKRAESSPGVRRIVFDFDSPGGAVAGIPELSDRIHAMRTPTVAVIQEAAGVAFWLASQADETIITPSGEAGGVGIAAHHDDLSGAMAKAGIRRTLIAAGARKVDGHPWAPLGVRAEHDLQRRVDELHDLFVQHVARGRGVSEATVRESFGQGRTLSAQHVVDAGMADSVATLDEVLTDPRAGRRGMKMQRFRRAFA